MISKKQVFKVRGRDEKNKFDNGGHPAIILHDFLNERIEFKNEDNNYLDYKSYTDEFVLIIRGTRSVLDDAGDSTIITLKNLTYFYTKKVHLLHKNAEEEMTKDKNGSEKKRLSKIDINLNDEDYQQVINLLVDNQDIVNFYHDLYRNEIIKISNNLSSH